jgi:catechol 2,3-dioxygenase
MPQVTAADTVSIAPATDVGAVHLAVTDGEQALAFYRDVLGLALLSRTDEEIRLGAGGRELVVLTPGASRRVAERTTGLYHLALLVPDRRELARVIGRLMSLRYPNAPTDHVMTKSDYLWDPDGNGIEVYAESPEDGVFGFENGMFVARDGSGALRSGRDPMDLEALFGELRPGDRLEAGLAPETKMGHVHLHVRDLREAVGFYHGLIGFDVMGLAERWGAAFVSAGGYHHHLGLNTWAGRGAPPRPVDAAGLRFFTIKLPDETSLSRVAARLGDAGVPLSGDPSGRSEGGWFLADPSRNRVRLTVRGA